MLTGVTEKRAGLQLSRAAVAVVLLTVHTNMLADKTDSSCSVEWSLNTDSSVFPRFPTLQVNATFSRKQNLLNFFSF